jgi:hypothetical protein
LVLDGEKNEASRVLSEQRLVKLALEFQALVVRDEASLLGGEHVIGRDCWGHGHGGGSLGGAVHAVGAGWARVGDEDGLEGLMSTRSEKGGE